MGRIALVTGGTRGIGAACSLALQAAGRTVIANYGQNDAAAIAFHAEHHIPVKKFNVCDFDACKTAIEEIVAQYGPVEIVVNNAGITRDGTMLRMNRDMWDAVIDTNLGSCFNICKLTFEGMRAAKFGRVVNIGSINGQAGQYGQVNYAAAKSGIHGFTKALAQEGAPKGVTVNAIAPGYMMTPDNMETPLRADPETREWFAQRAALKRWGQADELDGAVVYLSSSASAYCTGHVLIVDGGMSVKI